MSASLVSIILPVYNQANHIRRIVEEYEAILEQLPRQHEFILVTNGCSDDSPAICNKIAEDIKSVRTIDIPHGSWGLAVKSGLQEAHGDLLCYTNSARTSPSDLLLMLLYSVANPNSVIKANRKIRENWRRRLGSLFYNIECRCLFDLPCWDVNGTPKVFPRKFDQLLKLASEDDLIDLEFNVICRRERYPMMEVPIISYRRHGGKSTTNYASAFKMYWGAYKLWQSIKAGKR